MPRMEDILNLPVQDPPSSEFSADHIKWVKVDGGRQGGDDIAVIPYARVDDFVKGESSNAECPASFRIESRRKRPEGSISKPRVDGYLEYTLYWCSYGPEDYRDSESGIGDGTNIKPASGKGSRPGRRHMMRGCLCHFTVKRLYTRPLLALIIYNQRKHVDKTGTPCHGILDRDAVGTRAMYAPRISEELRQKVMFMLYVGISLDNIIQHHTEVMQRHGGPHNRDDFLTRNDVRNMERITRNSSHELQENDECSVRMWVQRHQKHVFCFQDKTCSEPFVLGIQTDWQLQQMLHYGHNSSISFHSTFGSKKLKYPLCSLLVFDSSQNAIPVAWVITSSFISHDIHNWIGLLSNRVRTKDPQWRPNTVLLDDPSFDISIVREAFQCRVLLCLWHVRRAWIKALLKKCCNFDMQREMFKQLGWILYCTRSGPNAFDAVEEFMQVFVDQRGFMEYFKTRWLPNIGMWVNAIKSLSLASQDPYAAIESYHLRLKSKLFNEHHSNFWQRSDWLIHILTTEFQSLYWLDQYSIETGYFENLRDKFFSTNAWYKALRLPDVDVILDEQNLHLAKVISQSDRNFVYTIWNPGSEFSFCDCPWSRLGNLCKHVIKVAMLCKGRQVARPLLAAQVYRQTLLTLLQNPPDDPLVLDHAILHVVRLQQDIKGLEDLSNSGLLPPLPTDVNSQISENSLAFSASPLISCFVWIGDCPISIYDIKAWDLQAISLIPLATELSNG
ncbi:Zinc finger protein [Quillaja saponaria]|uniref:Zinc finger protein n=1 Tax=Quillaja saponaria TaxID=32244 RepID=A0AAD7PT20_QUISA|nr:Zinc finger protein [Quillaja saponaria]KAJ7966089.1 Zinc finger protein [Quillaja saponaria]